MRVFDGRIGKMSWKNATKMASVLMGLSLNSWGKTQVVHDVRCLRNRAGIICSKTSIWRLCTARWIFSSFWRLQDRTMICIIT